MWVALKRAGCDVGRVALKKNRLITGADVRTGDFLPSRMRVAVLFTGQRLRRRCTVRCWPMCQRGASSSRLCHGPASCTDAAASGPKCGNRLGLGPGGLAATGRVDDALD